MMDISLLIPISIFAGIVLFSIVIYFCVRSVVEHRKLMEKIKNDGRSPASCNTTDTNSVSSPTVIHLYRSRLKEYFAKTAGAFGNIAKPKREEELSHVQKMLLNVGYRSKNVAVIFYGSKVLCGILLPAVFSVLKLFIHRPVSPPLMMFLFVLLALVGFYLPNVWLRKKIASRKEKILDGFPDALDLLVVCAEAGMGLDSAMDRVGEEMKLGNEVISEEFRLYNMEMRVGKPRQDALKNFASRTELDDVKNLVTLLIQTDKFGTSMAQALRVHSDTMRTQRHQRAEEKAVKLPVKLLLPLILCIFPSLFIVILGPAVVQVFRIFGSH